MESGTQPKERVANVRFEVFDYYVNIVLTDNLPVSRECRSIVLGKPRTAIGADVYGLHSYNEDEQQAFIFFREETPLGDIAHECSHAIWRMFNYFGAEFENELFAYHLGYLVNKAVALKAA